MATAAIEERELVQAMRWYDGFVVAMANPGFLLTSLGGSALTLGGWGAVALWLISVLIGALHNNIYAEVATMFPKLSGGVALYAHEAWKRYLSLIGPLAAFGYWIGWSVVLSINGVIVGGLIQAQWFPGTAAEGSAWIQHWSTPLGIDLDLNFPIWVAIGLIVAIWAFNVYGVRPAVWVGYVTGALLLIPLAVFMFLPYFTGDWSSSNLHNNVDVGSSLWGSSGIRLAIVWLYLMCWSSYGFECCASFAPEYKDPVRDTALALRSAAVFSILVYGLLPLGAIGTFGDQNLKLENSVSFYVSAFHQILGGATGLIVIVLCAGIVLSMNTATMDGSRSLYGISQDGMTVRQLGVLNRHHVPGNAMTLDALLNIFLAVFFVGAFGTGYLQILAMSNLGYVLSHIFAVSGFLLLRRDRPEAERPIRAGRGWLPIAWLCLIYDIILVVVGSVSFKLTGYGTGYKTLWVGLLVLGISLLLYAYRVIVQDKQRLSLRVPDETPQALRRDVVTPTGP